ncbi:hypothetical protein JMJ55_23035 [Belnapia sp. T6]|uniref:Uncharacterized protein n=1 Tax=Belnapia mucosa TaxID=2804532 RepID=A0ABS1V957_9PROT|nr:hypothetical protein [Belnapia mucosa]
MPNLLIVRLGIPTHSVPELIALCCCEPGRLSFGSSGAGTTRHIAGEIFNALGYRPPAPEAVLPRPNGPAFAALWHAQPGMPKHRPTLS